jgi:hypothetical protein
MAQVVDAAICSKTADHQPPFAQHEFEEQLARHSTPGAASMELTNTVHLSIICQRIATDHHEIGYHKASASR